MTIRNEEKTKSIYLVLSHSGTLTSKFLKIMTKNEYTHVSISLDKDLNHMYSFARIYEHFPLPGGFVKENAENNPVSLKTNCSIYELKVDKLTYEKINSQINSFLKEKNIYTYNMIGLAGAYFGLPIERKTSFFCSQFIDKLLKDNGVNLTNKPSGLVKPQDFAKSKKLVKVYEGNIYGYKKETTILI